VLGWSRESAPETETAGASFAPSSPSVRRRGVAGRPASA
jgi:hypothetical protein